ncbi:MAG: hypothetical protein A3K60_02170 [Euryarchaeota archaeon RBG_19FT_COMBO_56_21]|nr:MAG: hypothetical protein A3K60_02170 [Euryarchaeota archaeon RBG_19FT_COMBO_56_21]
MERGQADKLTMGSVGSPVHVPQHFVAPDRSFVEEETHMARRIGTAFQLCTVMMLTALVPLRVAEDHFVAKGSNGPRGGQSAVTWTSRAGPRSYCSTSGFGSQTKMRYETGQCIRIQC